MWVTWKRLACAMAVALLAQDDALAEHGVMPTEIWLGQSAALSGPSGELGKLFRDGALAYFRKVNEAGGVHGRQIRLLSLDDQYEPEQTRINTARLIDNEKVFALFGFIGTPTTAAALEQIRRAQIPLFAPMTGAEFLREPFDPLIFHIRAGYARETDNQLRQMRGNGRRRVAVLYEQGDFGQSTLELLRSRAEFYGLHLVGSVAIERNNDDVQYAVKPILSMKPDVVITVATYAPVAAFIRKMRRARYRGGFSNYSTVGGHPLVDRLAGGGTGTVVAQVVPFPWRPHIPIVNEYQKTYGSADGTHFSFVSLEGYIAARTLVEGLRRAGRDVTRSGFIQGLESIRPSNFDGGGMPLRFTADDHSGSDFVELTAVGAGGRFIN